MKQNVKKRGGIKFLRVYFYLALARRNTVALPLCLLVLG